MAEKEGTVEVKVKGETGELKSSMEEAAGSVKESISKMKECFEALTSPMSKVLDVLEPIKAILGGGEAFKESVDEAVKLNKEATELSEKLGVTATQASILNVALRDADLTSEQLQSGAKQVSAALEEDEQAFKKLGVQTRDHNGNLRNSVDVMLDVNARLAEMKDESERNAAGTKLYGDSWDDLRETVKLTSAQFEESRQKAEDFNLTVTKEGLESSQRYTKAMKDVEDIMTGVKNTIGEALMPVLAQLAEWFASVGPEVMHAANGAVQEVTLVFYGLKMAVEIVWETIKLNVQLMVDNIMRFADTAQHVLALDFSGAKEAWKNGTRIMEDDFSQAMDNISKKAAENRDKIVDTLQNWGHRQGTPPEAKEEGKHSGSGKKAKDDNKEQQQLAEERIAQVKKMNEIELGIAAEKYKHMKEMGEISQEGELQAMQAIAERKYEIERKALEDRLALHRQEPVAAQKIKNELLALEAKHAQEVDKISDQMELARKKASEKAVKEQTKLYQQMMAPVEQAISRSVQGMIQGTTTAQQALRNISQAILSDFINMIVKRTTQWAMGELAQMAATRAASTANMAVKAAEATATVGANAASAAAGAASSQAAIPIVGPGLAAAAFATTMALVLGAKSMIHSAAGGYDIPGGVNPLTQLHEKEMVLPAHIAEPLRNNLAGGGGGGHTINYHDYSGQLTPGEIERNVGVIARALKGYGRQFAY